MKPRKVTENQSSKMETGQRGASNRLFHLTVVILLLVGLISFNVSTPVAAQDDETTQPAATEEASPTEVAPPEPGALRITVYGNNGVALSGSFAVVDAAGAYFEIQVSGGAGSVSSLAPGTASVTQLWGIADFQVAPQTYIDIPSGNVTQLQVVNVFMDADADGVGDSVDVCASGSDLTDADGDGLADACDPTPYGEPTATPEPMPATGQDPSTAPQDTTAPDVATSGATDPAATETATAEASPIAEVSPAAEVDELGALSVEVAEEEAVVENSRVSCEQAADTNPWITSDLEDYPPGSLVTLTGGGWIPGQVIEIVVDDDGIADAEQGPWKLTGFATAGADGGFRYQFSIASWYVANYTVVATGECAQAQTSFTDSVTGGNCVQVSASDVVTIGQYIMFRCPSAQNPIRIGVTSISSGWQWSYVFSNDPNLAPPAYSSLNWNSTGTSNDSSASGGIQQAYFFLSPTTGVLPGATGSVSIQIKNPSGSTVLYTSDLLAYRNVTTADFRMTCTPATSTVPVPGTQAVSCTLSAINIATTALVNVAIPAVTPPVGWSVTSPAPASGTVTQAGPFNFSFTFTSSCSASSTAQSAVVASSLTFRGVAITGPTASVAIARATGTIASVGITSSSLSWSRPYSFISYPSNSGSIAYGVQASGCNGWNVTIVASNFTYSGSGFGTAIPASNLTLTGSTLPSGTGISTPATSGSLSSTLNVLSASATNGIGSYSQTLNLNLDVPAGVLAGAYQSTVTIAVASGP